MEIVGKCQLCSEPWDELDLSDADKTGYCPYCGYNPNDDTFHEV